MLYKRAWAGAQLPLLGPWACRWRTTNVWRVDSATPGLPSQPQDITTHRLVPNYTVWWRRHRSWKQLARGCTYQRGSCSSKPRLIDHKSSALLLRHRATHLEVDGENLNFLNDKNYRCAFMSVLVFWYKPTVCVCVCLQHVDGTYERSTSESSDGTKQWSGQKSSTSVGFARR